nr:SDR family oxidoreductase [Sphingomonas sp. Y57]
MLNLDGKIILVTGAGSGIGAAIAELLQRCGAQLVATDIHDDPPSGWHGGSASYARLDVTSEDDWQRVVGEIMALHGRLDGLVNNAGVIGPVDDLSLERLSLDRWRAIFRVNVEGAFLGCRTSLRALREARSGAIVNIASIAAMRATPHAPAYGASKAALHHLTLSVAQYCAEQGLAIRCCSVMPGDVRTPAWDRIVGGRMDEGAVAPPSLAELAAAVPLGDLGTADDIAGAVAFLLSDEARHITASPLIIDGGMTGCASFAARRQRQARRPARETMAG